VEDEQLAIWGIPPAAARRSARGPQQRGSDARRTPFPRDVTPEPTRHLGADPDPAASGRTALAPAAACDVYALGVRTDLVTGCRIALGIGSTTAYALAGRGELPFPAYRVGRQWVVPTAGLLTFLGLPGAEADPLAPG
jgi:hypothetical protein